LASRAGDGGVGWSSWTRVRRLDEDVGRLRLCVESRVRVRSLTLGPLSLSEDLGEDLVLDVVVTDG